jgi:hypothetical protein
MGSNPIGLTSDFNDLAVSAHIQQKVVSALCQRREIRCQVGFC